MPSIPKTKKPAPGGAGLGYILNPKPTHYEKTLLNG